MIILIFLLFLFTYSYSEIAITPYLPAGTKAETITVKKEIQVANQKISTTMAKFEDIEISTLTVNTNAYFLGKNNKVEIEGQGVVGNLTIKRLKGTSDIVVEDNLVPEINNNLSLGTSTYAWKELYLSDTNNITYKIRISTNGILEVIKQ